MRVYLDLMQDILDNGRRKTNRTGTNTLSLFGTQMRFNLAEGFPLVTTKRCHLKSIIYELLWFMQGRTSNTWLEQRGVTIWKEWADKNGDLGPIYGWQWRGFNATHPVHGIFQQSIVQRCLSWLFGSEMQNHYGVDQLKNSLEKLKTNPSCRRNIVSAWNPLQLDKMALAPCHLLFQFDVTDNKLSCQMYQRSCDFFLGVPFNIASYALLTMMMARMAGLGLGDFIWTGGDTHLYVNHVDQARLQLSREPRDLPHMHLKDRGQGLDDWEYEDFKLVDYNPHPSIKAPVAV
jgi:thymidylate synthase